MPFKKRNVRKFKRRPRRRRRKRRTMYQKSASPMGKKFTSKLRYYEPDLSIDPASGGLATSYVFSANGLFDPNITGTGHQPLAFDQMIQFYDHYTVIGARIRVDFINTDATNPQTVGIYVADGASTIADTRLIIENGLGKHRILGASNSGNGTTSMTMNVSIKKFLSSSAMMSDDRLKGTASSNPSEGVFFHIWAASPEGLDSDNVQFTTTLEQIVVWTEPKTLSLS